MNLTSLLALAAIVLVALASLWAIDRCWPLALPQSARVNSIDGLRGYLALGVFIHHSCIWYDYLQTGNWTAPSLRLFAQLGPVAVALFFMITAFLFTHKLLRSQAAGIDWLKLFVGRVMRIGPLWLVVKLLVLAIAVGITQLHWGDAPPHWLPQKVSTGLMTAGVTWTLYYEWTFYLLLPWLALLLRKQPTVMWLLFGAFTIALLGAERLVTFYSFIFLAGMVAVPLTQMTWIQHCAQRPMGSLLALGCLMGTLLGFDSIAAIGPTVLLTIAFVLIAAGADLWGLFQLRLSRVLGEITFSIYLLHGLLLFIVMRLVIGLGEAAAASWAQHWATVVALTPALIAVSVLSYRAIEVPAMRASPTIDQRMKVGLAGKTRSTSATKW